MADNETLTLAAEIVAAHVSHNSVSASDLPGLIRSVHAALAATATAPEAPKQEPAVSIRASIKPDYLICLEDGRKLKMLKRYLRTNYDMSPDEYRAKWGLPRDYPMVAPAYAETRRGLAHAIGLGRKTVADAAAEVASAVTEPARKRATKADDAGSDTPAVGAKRRWRPRKVDTTSQTEPTSAEA